MKGKGLVLFLAFSVLSGSYSIGRMQPANAQRTPAIDSPAKTKWEYCAIIRSGSMNENDTAVGIATIACFDMSGYREENVKVQNERVTQESNSEYRRAQQKALATMIAQLGNQGWEMIGHFPYNDGIHSGPDQVMAIYFKRAK
jgi:hypothetical protein